MLVSKRDSKPYESVELGFCPFCQAAELARIRRTSVRHGGRTARVAYAPHFLATVWLIPRQRVTTRTAAYNAAAAVVPFRALDDGNTMFLPQIRHVVRQPIMLRPERLPRQRAAAEKSVWIRQSGSFASSNRPAVQLNLSTAPRTAERARS